MYARLEIFMQLSPTLTKLFHIKRDYLVHIICAKSPKRAKTPAFRRLHKSSTVTFICSVREVKLLVKCWVVALSMA